MVRTWFGCCGCLISRDTIVILASLVVFKIYLWGNGELELPSLSYCWLSILILRFLKGVFTEYTIFGLSYLLLHCFTTSWFEYSTSLFSFLWMQLVFLSGRLVISIIFLVPLNSNSYKIMSQDSSFGWITQYVSAPFENIDSSIFEFHKFFFNYNSKH